MSFCTEIPFSNIDSIPNLVKDFLAQKLPDFSEYVFNKQNVENVIANKKSSFSQEKREKLSYAIAKQYEGWDITQLQKNNIALLKEENTFTVITGHQLNLFTGPSFFIYKILQTIKTAEYLNKNFPNIKVVPVFWLASEDHDFEEIHHFKTQNYNYETKGKSGGAAGRIKVEDQFFIHQFEKEFKDSVFGTELILRIKEAYALGNTLTEATKKLAQWLFADYGLLCIDGDDKLLKSEMKSVFKEELLSQSLQNKTKDKINFLSEKYGKVQVNPREINLFYLSETRNRIEKKGEKYQVADTELQFSTEEIVQELENYPEKFSPNAVMRPIYQENVLPNLMYIGGNAEVAYWLELKDYFQYLQIPFPVLVPRNSMLFLSTKTLGKIEKSGMDILDFFDNFAEVIKNELIKNNPLTPILEKKEAEIKTIFEEIKRKSVLTDITFKNLVEAEEKRQLNSYKKMQKRLLRAEKIKNRERLDYIEKLFLEVHPNKTWQERVLNFSVFYANDGKEWIKSCYDKMNVEKSVLIISEI